MDNNNCNKEETRKSHMNGIIRDRKQKNKTEGGADRETMKELSSQITNSKQDLKLKNQEFKINTRTVEHLKNHPKNKSSTGTTT